MPRSAFSALLFALGTCVAHASVLNTGQVFVNPNVSGGSGPFNQTTNNAGVVDINSPTVTGGSGSVGHGSAFVDYGVIKISGDSAGTLNSSGRGIIRDELTFFSPTLATGALVQVTYLVAVNGTLSVGPEGNSAVRWTLQTDLGGGAFDNQKGGELYGDSPSLARHGYFGDAFGTYSATATVQIGRVQQLTIDLFAVAQTGFHAGASSPSAFDLGHSLYWAGIEAVTFNGQTLSDFSVTSGSGTAYAQSLAPVPLPGSLLMLTPALALAFMRRRAG
jgi:hypothetical protein